MQPPRGKIFSPCLAASRVSMFTRRRRGWMVTLFRDMQPPPRKNFPACSEIFQAARPRMRTPSPEAPAVQTARPARQPCRSPGPERIAQAEQQHRPEPRSRSPRRSPPAGAEPGPQPQPQPGPPPGVYIGNSGRRNATPGPKIFCFPTLTIIYV